MSDSSQGPGWWMASDGKWYPPETAPDAQGTAPAQADAGRAGGLGRWAGRLDPRARMEEQRAKQEERQAGKNEGGGGKFGDGRAAPLYEFQASRFKGGRMLTPNVIRVWPDRIEEHEEHALRKSGTQAISFHQVSEVSVSRGIVWSDISVESTGGKSITMEGIPKGDADRVKKLIDDAVFALRSGTVAPPAPTASAPVADLADQLRKLADLRDRGILTEDEFATQKAKLLNG